MATLQAIGRAAGSGEVRVAATGILFDEDGRAELPFTLEWVEEGVTYIGEVHEQRIAWTHPHAEISRSDLGEKLTPGTQGFEVEHGGTRYRFRASVDATLLDECPGDVPACAETRAAAG